MTCPRCGRTLTKEAPVLLPKGETVDLPTPARSDDECEGGNACRDRDGTRKERRP